QIVYGYSYSPPGVSGSTVIVPSGCIVMPGTGLPSLSTGVPGVKIRSAGTTCVLHSRAFFKSLRVLPPSFPLMGAGVSGSATIGDVSTTIVTITLSLHDALPISQIVYGYSYSPPGVSGSTVIFPSGSILMPGTGLPSLSTGVPGVKI